MGISPTAKKNSPPNHTQKHSVTGFRPEKKFGRRAAQGAATTAGVYGAEAGNYYLGTYGAETGICNFGIVYFGYVGVRT